MHNIYRITSAKARSSYTPLPAAHLPTRRHPPQQPLKSPIDRHAFRGSTTNNRRNCQLPTPHPQMTSTPISRQTLVISRTTLIRALVCSRCPRRPENLQNPANPASDNRSTLVISSTTLIQALVCSRRPSHPENPSNPANPASDNPPNARDLSCNARKHSSYAHTSTRLLAAPLPSRKSLKSCKSCFRQSAQHSYEHSSVPAATALIPISIPTPICLRQGRLPSATPCLDPSTSATYQSRAKQNRAVAELQDTTENAKMSHNPKQMRDKRRMEQ